MKKIITTAAVVVAATFFSVAYAGDTGKSCGQMVAENAGMPGKLGELMNAYADTAEAHAAFMAANAKGDKNTLAEVDGMKKLAQTYRDTGAQLTKASEAMKAAGAWPAAAHDVKKLFADPKVKAAMDKEAGLQKEIAEMVAKMAPPPAKTEPAPAPAKAK